MFEVQINWQWFDPKSPSSGCTNFPCPSESPLLCSDTCHRFKRHQNIQQKKRNLWFSGSTGSHKNSRGDPGGVGSPNLEYKVIAVIVMIMDQIKICINIEASLQYGFLCLPGKVPPHLTDGLRGFMVGIRPGAVVKVILKCANNFNFEKSSDI